MRIKVSTWVCSVLLTVFAAASANAGLSVEQRIKILEAKARNNAARAAQLEVVSTTLRPEIMLNAAKGVEQCDKTHEELQEVLE